MADDHLSLVAGISKVQRTELKEWGISTLTALGKAPLPAGKRPKRGTRQGLDVLASGADGWFWDTEVMCRAFLNNLDVFEFPVLFLRRFDKQSTVKILPTVLSYLWELYRFRGTVGLSLFDRSPIYWTAVGYDLLINLLYGERHRQNLLSVAERIPEGAFVVELCSGTGMLYRKHLKAKNCNYLGLDANGHFVMACQKRGVPTRLFDLLTDDIPKADYVVIVSSMYHFQKGQDELMLRMLAVARHGA